MSYLDFLIVQVSWYQVSSPRVPLPLFRLCSSQQSDLLEKKVRYSQNHFVTSHLIWNRWVESSPPAPHLPVFSHFIYSTPNKQCILPFRGPPACNVLLGQGWFCNASWTGVGLCPREQVTTSETFLTSCLRGRKYHRQTVSRGQGCCYRVESIESPHNKEPSIPKRQGEQSFRSPSPWD